MNTLLVVDAAWRAYLCGVMGHIVRWSGTSTGWHADETPHEAVCERCYQLVQLRPPLPGSEAGEA